MHSQNPDTTLDAASATLARLNTEIEQGLWRFNGGLTFQELVAYNHHLQTKFEGVLATTLAAMKAALYDSEKTRPTPDPITKLVSDVESVRAAVAQMSPRDEALADAVKQPQNMQAVAKADPIEALIRKWHFATSPRVNGGWIAKGWRNGHCYSESRDTLAEAVNGVVAQIEADTKERTLSARGAGVAVARWAFDGAKSDTPTEWPDDLNQPAPVTEVEKATTLAESVAPAKPWTGVIVVALPSVYLVECSLDVTGNSVRVFDPTPTAMKALTLACINAEREPVLVIDGKGLPAFARICKVECNHLVGLAPPQCTLTLMGGSVT